MDEIETAALLTRVLQWASDKAESPAFVNFEYQGDNSFTLLAVPGRRMLVTVTEIEDDGR